MDKHIIGLICLLMVLSVGLGYNLPKEGFIAYDLKQIGVAGTGSMNPIISKNDKLIIEKVKINDTLKLGNIYVFRKWNSTNKSVVHRLVSQLNSTHYLFKGDANRIADVPIERSKVIYEVRGIKFG